MQRRTALFGYFVVQARIRHYTVHRRADGVVIHVNAAAFGLRLLHENDSVSTAFACSAHDGKVLD